jgi:hypothetical protein
MPHWKVEPIGQRTASLCWEACARMMWKWKHKTLDGYNVRAAPFLRLNTGLVVAQMDTFYASLGMRMLSGAEGKNLRFALKWTPVIFTLFGEGFGHALTAAGFHGNKYAVINPCGSESVTFGENDDEGAASCTVTERRLPFSEVDSSLGGHIWYW